MKFIDVIDDNLKEFFTYIVENEGLPNSPTNWHEAKENFEKIVALCTQLFFQFSQTFISAR